jgi:hypothetical protein
MLWRYPQQLSDYLVSLFAVGEEVFSLSDAAATFAT